MIEVDPNTYYALVQFQAQYAAVLDAGDWERWPDFFLEACTYRIQPRENFERGLPLATMAFESRGMLKDRVYGIKETLFHDPYYQRHVLGPTRVLRAEAGRFETETSYAVFRTKLDEYSTVYNVGRYLDVIHATPEGYRFESRICVFDSEMIANSIIYPI
ncbi:MAG: aromatic-ring-hydroxylating dioxygenase subunit beta [Usitatibacter sp.]